MRGNDLNAFDLLSCLRGLGVELRAKDDRLLIDAPKGVLDSSLREGLSLRKAEILRMLSDSASSGTQDPIPLKPVSRDEALPLSFGQERLWFLHQLERESTAYSLPMDFRLKGKLEKKALKQTFVELARRHETLRTTFRFVDGRPEQVIASEPTLALEEVDLRKLSAEAREAEVIRLADEQAQKPFDLVAGPLLRIVLYQLDEEEHVMHVNMHHIISDYWSLGVMRHEFVELYKTFAADTPSQLPELPIQYVDFAYWQRRWLQGEVLDTHLAYWKEKLRGELPVLQLPTDRPRPRVQTHRGAEQSLILPKRLIKGLKDLSRCEGVTLYMTLLAAFKVLLYRLTGQGDILVGSPIAGRNRVELEGLIGFFVNTVVMRTDLSGEPTFKGLLERVRDTALGAYAHQEMPFEKLVEELAPKRDLSHSPLFQVFFNHMVADNNQVELPGLEIEVLGKLERESNFELTLYVRERNGGITLTALYNTNLFSHERMICFLEQYRNLLEQIVAETGKPIQSYSLATPESLRILPNPREPLAEARQRLVTDMFVSWVKRSPKRPAVSKGDQLLTYEELSDRAQILARSLQLQGAGRGEVVAVCGPRSFGLIVSMMAVLFNGNVLLPIDDRLPRQRQQLMLREAGARFVLSVRGRRLEEERLDQAPALDGRIIEVDAEGLVGEPEESKLGKIALPELSIEEAAYIFFTSGTTGTPKGVLGSHKGLSHFLTWQRETFGIAPEDRVAQFTSLSFDPVLREIFLPLTSGATLCLPENLDILASNDVLSWLERERISILHTVPTLAQSWLTTATVELPLSAIRLVFFAGEALTGNLVQKWQSAFPGGEVINLYGPTETTLAKCFYRVSGDVHPGVEPVGRPLPQTQALVLGGDNRLCGIGEPGEIVLRTPFRSLGYVNNEEENRKRFVKNPFRDDEADYVYFTGDRGCYRPDGMLECLGRLDDQIKIRGVRVEPNEIAVTLAKHPAVDSCFVSKWKDEQGQPSLVAYVVVAKQNSTTVSELRSYLMQGLPATMVPEAFVFMDALPVTPRGKIDRRGLPAPDRARPELGEVFVEPRTQSEELVARIWSDVLGRERIGVHDNFFDLGGHSLRAIQIISRIHSIFKIEMPLQVMFEAQTVERLANKVAMAIGGEKLSKITNPPTGELGAAANMGDSQDPRTATERRLVAIWERLLDVKPIGVRKNLFELGGNSVLFDQMLAEVRSEFGVFAEGFPVQEVINKPTIEALARLIDDSVNPASSLLVCLQTAGSKTPLILIHAAGGYVFFYRALASRLGPDRPVYAVRAETKCDGMGQPFERSKSIESLAARYINEIKIVQPQGPYSLGGACFGGVVALEMARQLRSQGEEVGPVFVFDPPVAKSVRSRRQRIVYQFKYALTLGTRKWIWYLLSVCQRNIKSEIVKAIRETPRRSRAIVLKVREKIEGINTGNGEVSVEEKQRRMMKRIREKANRLLSNYKPDGHEGTIIVFKAERRGNWNPEPSKPGFAKCRIVVHTLPGLHLEMMEEPAVMNTATLVRKWLD